MDIPPFHTATEPDDIARDAFRIDLIDRQPAPGNAESEYGCCAQENCERSEHPGHYDLVAVVPFSRYRGVGTKHGKSQRGERKCAGCQNIGPSRLKASHSS